MFFIQISKNKFNRIKNIEYSIYIIVRQINILIMMPLCLLLLVSVSCFQETVKSQDNKNMQKLIWFNVSQTEMMISPLIFFKGGYANYFQSKINNPSDQNPFKKLYFNLFPTSSQFSTIAIYMCHQNQETTFCQAIQKNYIYSNKLITKQSSSGQLLLTNDLSTKIINLNQHGHLLFEQRKPWKEILEFTITCIISLSIITALFYLNLLKFLDQLSYIQLTFSIIISIYHNCDYIKQAIQNWNSKNIQFFLFIPLIFITYRILEQIIEKIINGTISIKIIIFSVIVNTSVAYFTSNSIIFPALSTLLIFRCNIERQTYQIELSKFKKEEIISIQNHIVSFFSFVNFSLLFKKKWIYIIHVNPQYFIIGCLLITIIYLTNLYRKILIAKLDKKIANKLKIKVLTNKSDLKKELSQSSLSQIVQHQCPICYQKIESNWAKTPCDHIFHDYCLYQWLERNQTCPIDRKKVLSDKFANSGQQRQQALEA